MIWESEKDGSQEFMDATVVASSRRYDMKLKITAIITIVLVSVGLTSCAFVPPCAWFPAQWGACNDRPDVDED